MYLSACRPKVSRVKTSLDTFKNIKIEIHNIFDPAARENLSLPSSCFLAFRNNTTLQKFYDALNSLTAIDCHDRQFFNELLW